MIAIDTNVLVRVLVDDPGAPEQCRQSRDLLKESAEAWVSEIVLIETIWVLESAYHFTKTQLLDVLTLLAHHPGIRTESGKRLDVALALYSIGSVDFSDCLILANAMALHLELFTFDKKLARLHGVTKVG